MLGKILKALVAPITAGKKVLGPIITAVGIATGQYWLASIGVSMTVGAYFGPGTPKTQLSRLNISLDPTAPRKAVFGTTAMPLDLRYHEASGTDQEYIEYVIAVASHEVKDITEIWFEEKKAWDSTSGVTATYSGYLSNVTIRKVGTSANTVSVAGGTIWGSDDRLTGCAYVYFKIKRTGADKKSQSPLVNGIPSRITIRGDGALLYDPRKDSTVTGGSGTHRADDQTTWGSYTAADDTDNPALQLLWWLLGWKINGKLSIGCGVPPERIDLPSFIAAANICDENIALAGGGTQKRYQTSGTASDADDRMDIISTFLTCMNGSLRDENGKLALTVIKNDLSSYVLDLNDDDILGEFEWKQTRGLDQTYNVVRGRYVDPSDNALYQMVDYPEVAITSLDGIERVMALDLPYVEDGKRAQRIAKQALQRNQYGGTFRAVFKAKAYGANVGEVVRLSFETLGWTNKLFRVISKEVGFDGTCPMELIEENAAIYAWDAEESPPVSPPAPTVYNPLNDPFILGTIEASETATWTGILGTGTQPDGVDVAGTINAGGGVADNQVTTPAIVAEAVTTKAYAFTSGSVNIPSGGYTYVQVQTATITSTGEDVEIDGYFELDVIDNCKYQYRFIRDTTTLITLGPITVNTSDGPPAFFRYVDSPTAGTYTYKVEVACNDANNINVLNRGLSLKEIKR